MVVIEELASRARDRGARVEARLEILRELAGPDGDDNLLRRIEELNERIRDAAQRVRDALR